MSKPIDWEAVYEEFNWDEVYEFLPVYAYEYWQEDENGSVVKGTYSCWLVREHVGEEPPPGWMHVDRDEGFTELQRAITKYLQNKIRLTLLLES